MWFKRKRKLPEKAFMDWSFEVWQWLLFNGEGYKRFLTNTQLVSYDLQFFPHQHVRTYEWACSTLDTVAEHMGMQSWQAYLKEDESSKAQDYLLNSGVISSYQGAAGAFGYDENGAVIYYDSKLLEFPERFIATMAHELSHYFLDSFPTHNPGGSNVEEHATDLCALYKGFGIFLLNGYYHMGVSGSSTQGYLNEQQLAFNLAIFLKLKNTSPETIKPLLKKALYRYLTDSFEEIEENYHLKITWLASTSQS